MRDSNWQKFYDQMDDLWERYLLHCKEEGHEPTTKERFSEAVYGQVMKVHLEKMKGN